MPFIHPAFAVIKNIVDTIKRFCCLEVALGYVDLDWFNFRFFKPFCFRHLISI